MFLGNFTCFFFNELLFGLIKKWNWFNLIEFKINKLTEK